MRDINIGYSGQKRSNVSGHYLLGDGYRGFNPVLKRFMGQDSMSPFNAGGAHGFAYCGCNPVNQTDQSGHIGGSWLLFISRCIGFVAAEEVSAAEASAVDALAVDAGEFSFRAAEASLEDMPEHAYESILQHLDYDSLENLSNALPQLHFRPEFDKPFQRLRAAEARSKLIRSINSYKLEHSVDFTGLGVIAMIHEAWIHRELNGLTDADLIYIFRIFNKTNKLFHPDRGVFFPEMPDLFRGKSLFKENGSQYLPPNFNGKNLSYKKASGFLNWYASLF